MKDKCPSDGALIAMFMSGSSSRRADRVLRHLAACARCSFRFNILRQVKRDLQPGVDAFADAHPSVSEGAAALQGAAVRKSPPSRPRPSGMVFGFRFAVGFVAVLAVVAAGGYLTQNSLRRHSELRSPSPRLNLLAPIGPLSSAPSVFRWTPVLNAEDYAIELIDDRLECVQILSTFLITEAVLPADLRSKLVRGRTYVWSVSARDGDGALMASTSGSFIIE
jgi:hypothetical protein